MGEEKISSPFFVQSRRELQKLSLRINRELKRVRILVFWIFIVEVSASAQTVRPLIAELSNPAKGRVEYVNDTMTPLNVILEASSFAVSETGNIEYRPLESSIHLKLSATSFRIQPQQTYYVFYEANTEASSAWFVIYARFSGFPFRTQQGMNIRLGLPHTVYLLPKQLLEKSQVRVSRAEFLPNSNKVLVEVENAGDYFGRVLETSLTFGKKKQEAPGFPVFPHSRRLLEIPVAQTVDGLPGEVELRFQRFKLAEKVSLGGP
jgi:hypothetical protein